MMDRWEILKEGLRLYNASLFYECHEVLEGLWKDEPDPDLRNYLWMVIQLAGAWELVRLQRQEASHRLFLLAKEKAKSIERINPDFDQDGWINRVQSARVLEDLKGFKFQVRA